ncbi:uncharacterized protein CCOS01_09232 [Colletotrichum costaricense]|uniref:Uncharacterized protein n=2 Tax=Colletotrichum acutatum species complex TaxID=2707335 RepID=A0AAJ0DZV4_9PEZI|nr:uncharacterized protein CCOS01_09232 [Colletotrichum costaricense]XP_060384359.1 uncharacterized protein CTAM01_04960 [Colletotrichum tamarilloi]KAI3536480.1 hypothetical protein CSPX01_10741 [Colletotrichum filicis]KAK1502971.1 hypothetical protein CTAM01_04960 [Colletotrichum tamarilloi]KAK1524145.1 hypothetical protein CCOS01_09232 [Colletotrichum costaricense]
MAPALLSGIRGLLAGIYGPRQQTDGLRRAPATRLARQGTGYASLATPRPITGDYTQYTHLWNPNFRPMEKLCRHPSKKVLLRLVFPQRELNIVSTFCVRLTSL